MKSLDKDNLYSPQIIHEDNHLCVAYKPPGWIVPKETHQQNSLEQFLLKYYQNKLSKSVIFLVPIHRLDKPVAGIVVFARSSKALKRLQQQQKERGFSKFYLAWVEGEPKLRCSLIKHQLLKETFYARVVKKGGKETRLRYRCINSSKEKSLLSIQLLTGRYHQIRAQLKAIGHPIIGDIKYGSKVTLKETGIKLFHTKFCFQHPVSRKPVVIKLRPPQF